MQIQKSFGSDNHAGTHPEIIKAITSANKGHVVAYGEDAYTKRAVSKIQEIFGKSADPYFVFSGTPANVLAIKAMTEPHNAIICANTAHINVDECGAPERFTGCKLLPIATKDGKIAVDDIKPYLTELGNEHHSQPKVISLTQATEYGTIYTKKEMKAVADFAHESGLLLHVDGARLANAAVSLGATLKEITADVGVDALSLGGTKNGLLFGDAIIFFNKALSKNFKFIRKQGMQLSSKMRFISAQFEALLSNGLWFRNAKNANQLAQG